MKKRALNQRVLYKISHLTISSLVLISNKREGQVILYYHLETIHLRWKRSQLRETFADKVMLECCYQLCAFASADSKSKVEPCGACISFIQLRLVVFMISRLRAKKQTSQKPQTTIQFAIYLSSIHISEQSSKIIIVNQ